MANAVSLKLRLGDADNVIEFKGRDAWTLDALITAGDRGCTPIDRPAPRWSHYVYRLRRAGIAVETIHESHAGPYAGTHARYVLRTPATVVERRVA